MWIFPKPIPIIIFIYHFQTKYKSYIKWLNGLKEILPSKAQNDSKQN